MKELLELEELISANILNKFWRDKKPMFRSV